VKRLRVVHLPVYRENAYQPLLLESLAARGVDIIEWGEDVRFLRTALFRWKADILHFHWLHPFMLRESRAVTLLRSLRLLGTVFVLRLAGQRVVWTVHNLKNHDNLYVGIERFFTRLVAKLADGVIAHCEMAKRAACSAFGLRDEQRVAVIPHGTYVGRYPDHVPPDEARRRLNLPPDAVVFLFLGRIQPYKGALDLIDAFRRLPAPHARLVIAGRAGGDVDVGLMAGRATLDPRVIFRPGHVPDEEVQTYMNAADVVVCPYRDLLTSSAVVLAMSFGKACIAPHKGCLPETLPPDGRFLYDPSDPQGLSRALVDAVERRKELPRMGHENRAATERWRWDRVAAATLEVYRKALGRPWPA
jgi:glycosyltransferase involved in cell wall biosynthesis